tara:strand:- start:149 stop:1117 length:969 start_codon:yes stop_codon:yes gene_type:complete
VTGIIPNQSILISTLSLQEAKDSSAIENIITTHDELYKSDSMSRHFESQAAKEVYNYAAALKEGWKKVKNTQLLTNSTILEIQSEIVENNAGFRSIPGTEFKNEQTGDVVYTPPQEIFQIKDLMSNLEQFINDDTLSDLDPLVKMALIHHQFESIHPFYDGNGRTGRIINVLYLVKEKLLDTPVLYLSRYVNQNKAEYYRLLQDIRDGKSSWEEWILFMLDAVEETSYQTTKLVRGIQKLMQSHKKLIREALPKVYSQDLLNIIFCHPYTKISFIEQELGVARGTATSYLNQLVEIELMSKLKVGKSSYYINKELFKLLIGS